MRRGAFVVVVLVLAGCSVGPDYRRPELSVPADFRGRAPEAGFLQLSVEDDGCGMAPEVRDRVFDPFFTTKQSSGGTGLGLAIVQGIIEQHRGQIRVESEVGRGTAFHFLLPVKGSDAA